jgi:MFS family permease
MVTTEVNKKIGYKDVLKQKEYMKLIFANVINRFGDSIDSIAFTWLVFSLTGSAAWSALIFGINRVPTIFLQPFAGALVENLNKKFIMVVMDIIRGVCVSLIAVLLILNLLNPWILLLMTVIISSAEAFRGPAGTAVLPRILDKSCYEFGISLNTTLTSIVELAGLALAGAIIGFFGTQTAIFIDGATFWGSALIILFIRTGEEKKSHEKVNFRDYFDTLKGGFDYIRRSRIIINFILLAMATNAILVPLNSLEAPLVKDILKQGGYLLSVLGFSLSLGLGIGSILYPYIARKLNIRTIIFIGGTSLSLYYIILILCSHISTYKILVCIICTVSSLITGCALSFMLAALNIQFMKNVETDYLARAGAIMNSGNVCTMPLVSFIISFLSAFLPVSVIFYAMGGFGIILFLFVYLKKIKFD